MPIKTDDDIAASKGGTGVGEDTAAKGGTGVEEERKEEGGVVPEWFPRVARTPQITRKSVGGKAPRKKIACMGGYNFVRQYGRNYSLTLPQHLSSNKKRASLKGRQQKQLKPKKKRPKETDVVDLSTEKDDEDVGEDADEDNQVVPPDNHPSKGPYFGDEDDDDPYRGFGGGGDTQSIVI